MRPGFTGSPLDRADKLRNDAQAFSDAMNDWRARVLELDGLDPVIASDGGLSWRSIVDFSGDVELVLLGLDDGKPHFVPLVTTEGNAMRSPSIWRALSILPSEEAAVYGAARSLIDWHNNHAFCARCGGDTKLFRAGWGRTCTACNKEHFPRTDPVVIMIAEHQDRALLGRQAAWPEGNYSALAGFLEPGESIEEAVARELFEEAGIRVNNVRYVTSQPWPFGGAQLMIACVAEAESDQLVIDHSELEDARWFSREDVAAVLADAPEKAFNTPPPFAIAHTLLKHWAQ